MSNRLSKGRFISNRFCREPANWNAISQISYNVFLIVLSPCIFFCMVKVKPCSQDWLIAAGAYPGFCNMKRLEVFLLPLDVMLVHRRSLPRNLIGFPQQFTGTHLYTWVGRRTVRVKCFAQEHNNNGPTEPGLEPGPLAPESSALTMRPPRLPQFVSFMFIPMS